MKVSRIFVVLCVCSLVLASGCPRTTSCNIRTQGMFFAYRVVEENGQATVSAVFSVGSAGGTELELGAECGDDIAVNGIPLQARVGAFVWYEAVIDLADDYEFVFTREGEGSYSSTVTPAPLVNLTAPAQGTAIDRDDPFDITWDAWAGSSGINLLITGPCIEGLAENIADNGTYTINAEALDLDVAQEGEGETCDVNIALTRYVEGAMDPALNGFINARTRAQTWFSSTP